MSREPESRRTGAFAPADLIGLWDDHDYYRTNYEEPAPSERLVAEVEAELGFRLPDSYVELARHRNGGGLARPCLPMEQPTSWAEDHIRVTGIYAIGRTAPYSLLGGLGAAFMRDEWGYPAWGVGIADTPSAGHELLMLDYRGCDPEGEPAVVHVDQELDFRVTRVAPDFARFVQGLVGEAAYDDSEDELQRALLTVQRGSLSPVLRRALDAAQAELPDGEALIRALAERIVQTKGGFYLHADDDSVLMYDVMLWLHSHLASPTSFEDFFERAPGQQDYGRPCYVLMIATSFVADPYSFRVDGYAASFVTDWWDERLAAGAIVRKPGGYAFAPAYSSGVLARLRAVPTG